MFLQPLPCITLSSVLTTYLLAQVTGQLRPQYLTRLLIPVQSTTDIPHFKAQKSEGISKQSEVISTDTLEQQSSSARFHKDGRCRTDPDREVCTVIQRMETFDDLAEASSCWGDTNFADATVLMGQKTWPVHRLVICKQSRYFAKAFEGHFMVSTAANMTRPVKLLTRSLTLQEAKTKTIDLMDCDFLEEEVDGLLKYLYTRQMDARQIKSAARTFIVADYFQVRELRDKAVKEAANELQRLIAKNYFITYKDRCHKVLGQYPGTDLEAAIVKVIANNMHAVKHNATAGWDELTAAYPTLAKKVLDVIFQEPEPEPSPAVKRLTSVAFDDYVHEQQRVASRYTPIRPAPRPWRQN